MNRRRTEAFLGLLLLTVLASVLAPASAVSTDTFEGLFVEYSFTSTVSDEDGSNSTSGEVRYVVLADYGNGSVRIETSGRVGKTTFTLERDAPQKAALLPFIVGVPEGSFSRSSEQGEFNITSIDTGVESIAFQGAAHSVNVTEIVVEATHSRNGDSYSASSTGLIKVFQSNLLYSVTLVGELRSSEAVHGFSTVIELTSTNINVDEASFISSEVLVLAIANSPGQASLAPIGVPSLPSGGFVDASPTPILPAALAIGLVGLGLGLFFGLRSRRGREVGKPSKQKPLHWVH